MQTREESTERTRSLFNTPVALFELCAEVVFREVLTQVPADPDAPITLV